MDPALRVIFLSSKIGLMRLVGQIVETFVTFWPSRPAVANVNRVTAQNVIAQLLLKFCNYNPALQVSRAVTWLTVYRPL